MKLNKRDKQILRMVLVFAAMRTDTINNFSPRNVKGQVEFADEIVNPIASVEIDGILG